MHLLSLKDFDGNGSIEIVVDVVQGVPGTSVLLHRPMLIWWNAAHSQFQVFPLMDASPALTPGGGQLGPNPPPLVQLSGEGAYAAEARPYYLAPFQLRDAFSKRLLTTFGAQVVLIRQIAFSPVVVGGFIVKARIFMPHFSENGQCLAFVVGSCERPTLQVVAWSIHFGDYRDEPISGSCWNTGARPILVQPKLGEPYDHAVGRVWSKAARVC
jgi:hypothetical protein